MCVRAYVSHGIIKAQTMYRCTGGCQRLRLARGSGAAALIRRYTHVVRYISRLRRYIGADNVRPASDILERVADGERSRYAVSSRVGTVSIISWRAAYILEGRSRARYRASFRVSSMMRSNCKKLAPNDGDVPIRHVSFFHGNTVRYRTM